MTVRLASARRFAFTRNDPPSGDWEHLTEDDFLDRPGRVTSAASMSGRPAPDWARDLLEIARGAFLVDKRFRRDTAPDRWSRRIELLVQLRAPDPWNEEVCHRVGVLLGTLTGDEGHVNVHGGLPPEPQPELPLGFGRPVSSVALLSGGLDSACHAASLAGARLDGTVLFVSFVDRVRRPQVQLVDALKQIGGGRGAPSRPAPEGGTRREAARTLQPVTRIPLHGGGRARRVRPRCAAGRRPGERAAGGEPTAHTVPAGALSTRSVHPWTLHQINQLTTTVGGDVEVVNPLLGRTKGEVCALGLGSGLTEADLLGTVTCGRHTHLGNRNCGSCFPCLVRRSGLLHVLGADGTDYDHHPREKPQDLRAVRSWLSREFGERDLIADMPWPPGTTARTVLPVLQRGRVELAQMVERL